MNDRIIKHLSSSLVLGLPKLEKYLLALITGSAIQTSFYHFSLGQKAFLHFWASLHVKFILLLYLLIFIWTKKLIFFTLNNICLEKIVELNNFILIISNSGKSEMSKYLPRPCNYLCRLKVLHPFYRAVKFT